MTEECEFCYGTDHASEECEESRECEFCYQLFLLCECDECPKCENWTYAFGECVTCGYKDKE